MLVVDCFKLAVKRPHDGKMNVGEKDVGEISKTAGEIRGTESAQRQTGTSITVTTLRKLQHQFNAMKVTLKSSSCLTIKKRNRR